MKYIYEICGCVCYGIKCICFCALGKEFETHSPIITCGGKWMNEYLGEWTNWIDLLEYSLFYIFNFVWTEKEFFWFANMTSPKLPWRTFLNFTTVAPLPLMLKRSYRHWLPWFRPYAKNLTYIKSFNPHNSPLRQVTFTSLFHRWANRGTEKLNNLSYLS